MSKISIKNALERSTCVICYGVIPLYGVKSCDQHPVCGLCIRQYLEHGKHQDYALITCPTQDCLFTFKDTQKLVDAVFTNELEKDAWWRKVYTDVYIKNKITCPFTDCKAIFDADFELSKQCIFSECYECHRGFCIACMNPWHPGEIRIVNDTNEAMKTLEAAKKNNWTRCPTCKKIIQKQSGCHVIACFCGSSFCYRCGSKCVNHNCTRMCNTISQAQLTVERQDMFKL